MNYKLNLGLNISCVTFSTVVGKKYTLGGAKLSVQRVSYPTLGVTIDKEVNVF